LPRADKAKALLRALPGVDALVIRVEGHAALAGVTRRRLTEASRHDVAQDHFVDAIGVDPGAADGFPHHQGPELRGAEALQAAQELPGRRAHGREDDGLTGH